MLQRFSEKLISDAIGYFENRDLKITAEQAEEYLDSLAKLYKCFEGLSDQKCSDFCREAKSEHFCLGQDKTMT